MNHESAPAAQGRRLADILGLASEPVAVYLVSVSTPPPAVVGTWDRGRGHRYCQLLMRARHGESLRLMPEDLACPAAFTAFGFGPLPAGLATGKGLMGFGIVVEAEVGRVMFETMPRLATGAISAIAACPLSQAPSIPDVVVVEGPPESLMWLLLADLNVADGQRRRGDTAVLQATCVDATVIPFLERRMNFALGCYGCREATDLGPAEAVLGFPGESLEAVVAALERLSEKAIGRSRAKTALGLLTRKMSREHD